MQHCCVNVKKVFKYPASVECRSEMLMKNEIRVFLIEPVTFQLHHHAAGFCK